MKKLILSALVPIREKCYLCDKYINRRKSIWRPYRKWHFYYSSSLMDFPCGHGCVPHGKLILLRSPLPWYGIESTMLLTYHCSLVFRSGYFYCTVGLWILSCFVCSQHPLSGGLFCIYTLYKLFCDSNIFVPCWFSDSYNCKCDIRFFVGPSAPGELCRTNKTTSKSTKKWKKNCSL